MMSATTAFTETPATTPTPGTASTAGTSTSGTAPNVFQNLLAGAVLDGTPPALTETLPGLQPGQTVAQLFAQKNPGRALAAQSMPPVAGAAVSASEMLELLNQSGALLPGMEAAAHGTNPGELLETREAAKAEDDVLSDWLNIMIPYSVLASQAGTDTGDSSAQQRGGTSDGRDDLTAILTSLQRQAGNPDGVLSAMAPPQVAPPGSSTVAALERSATAAAAAAPLAALAAATAPTESRESTATGDEWMNSFGDLTAKRAHELASTAAPRLMTPVHDARWADALAHRLVLMAREGESVAQLRLIPQELGPLDIQISVRDGEASVHFGAAQAETRSALEASLPRLRELLSAQGLQLANASVSHQSANGGRPDRHQTVNGVTSVVEEAQAAHSTVMSTSLLDIYA